MPKVQPRQLVPQKGLNTNPTYTFDVLNLYCHIYTTAKSFFLFNFLRVNLFTKTEFVFTIKKKGIQRRTV